MVSVSTLFSTAKEREPDLLFGEAQSQESVQGETRISNPGKPVVPATSVSTVTYPNRMVRAYQFRPPPTCSGRENVGAATIAPVSSNTSILLYHRSAHSVMSQGMRSKRLTEPRQIG